MKTLCILIWRVNNNDILNTTNSIVPTSTFMNRYVLFIYSFKTKQVYEASKLNPL